MYVHAWNHDEEKLQAVQVATIFGKQDRRGGTRGTGGDDTLFMFTGVGNMRHLTTSCDYHPGGDSTQAVAKGVHSGLGW
jgi:hypothetical protein